MTDEQCSSLSILQGVSDRPGKDPPKMEGVIQDTQWPFTISCWQPSKEDLEALKAGRPIWVRILSHTVYPMELFTTDEGGVIN